MSREIFLVNDYDGVFKERVEFQRLRRKSIRIPLSLRDIPPLEKGGQTISLRRTPRLTSVAFGATGGRAPRGRRFNVQYKRKLGPGSRVLCRTPRLPKEGG